MSHSTAPSNPPAARMPCVAADCDFDAIVLAPLHPEYCSRDVGREITAHILPSERQQAECPWSYKLDFTVTVASAYRDTESGSVSVEAASEIEEHHTNVVQLHVLLLDDTELNADFSSGAARSLAATLIRAADIIDGLAVR